MKIGKWYSGLGIKQKVQYIFVFAIALCVLFCFIFFYFLMRSRMTDTVLEKSRNSLSSIKQNFDSVIDNVNNISKLIMVNDIIMSYLKSDNESLIYTDSEKSEMNSMLNLFLGTYSVFVFKNDRNYINAAGIGVISADKTVIYDKCWFDRVSSSGGSYVLIPNTKGAFISNTDANLISFARTINDIDTQKPLGMLVINIPVSELEKTYMNLANEDNHFAYIDNQGNVLCSDKYFDELDDILINNSKAEVIQTSYEGILHEQVVSSTMATDSGFIIVNRSSVQIMEGMSVEIFFSLFGVLIITIVAMVIINAYINKYITYPISKLADSMSMVEKGLLRRVSIPSNDDEIGKLKSSYNQMLIQINRLIDEVIKEEQKRQKAEIDALQEQIKPHFLYNTLDTIGYMSLMNSPEEVYDAIETLGNFYRKFLSKGSQAVQLSDEISIVKDYIKLQKLRYEDLFDDEYFVQDNLGTLMLPKLILQPLVENSISHGIRPKGEKGIIRVSASADDKNLYITVYDSGIGMSSERIKQLMHDENKRSFGFKGTIDRIRYFYHVEDVVEIRSVEGEFCEIKITVPLDGYNTEHNFKSSERSALKYVQGDDN